MRHSSSIGRALLVFAATFASAAGGQSVAQRITEADGTVQVLYASRPGACGDGISFIGNVLGRQQRYVGDATWSGQSRWDAPPCVRGPARVVATVIGGEVTRLRAYVGPPPTADAATRTLRLDAADAAAWLSGIVSSGNARIASQAMFPLVLVDAADPWPLFLRVARDLNRPKEVRQSAITWLSTGITDHLGLSATGADTDDEELRAQAVYTLTQRPKTESVPALIDLARTARHAAARKAAIYWLGQSGDARALDVYAELLGVR
jgi:hypothetical protein